MIFILDFKKLLLITTSDIQCAVMSSHDPMGIVFKCLSKGAVDFLVKPIRKNELKNLWQHVWRRGHSVSMQFLIFSCIFVLLRERLRSTSDKICSANKDCKSKYSMLKSPSTRAHDLFHYHLPLLIS